MFKLNTINQPLTFDSKLMTYLYWYRTNPINVVDGWLIDIISAVRDSIFKRGGLGYVAREEGWYLINLFNTATNKQFNVNL